MWKDFDTKFKGILERLSRHKGLVESRASVTQYRIYQEDIAAINARVGEMVMQNRNKQLGEVKEWFAVDVPPDDYHLRHQTTKAEYQGTGNWIIEKNEAIRKWLDTNDPDKPLLWMTGIPGAGKTILASVVVDECKSRTDCLTNYYYCQYSEAKGSAVVGVLKGLLSQLLDQHSELLPHCHSQKSHSGEPSLRSLVVAKRLLVDFCSAARKRFMIIDGVDEYETAERKQLLEFLVELVRLCDEDEPGKLRVLVVSQDFPDIRKELHNCKNPKILPKIISLSSADNKNDIHTFVGTWVNRIKEKYAPLGDEQCQYLLNLTVEKAHG